MSRIDTRTRQLRTATSADGAEIAYETVGSGPGLLVVGGVLTTGADYRRLADELATTRTVHVMQRRGRPGSAQQGPAHSLAEETADLLAVARATGAQVVFGHSFGGFIALEAARRSPELTRLIVFEPALPSRSSAPMRWLAEYQERLARGDRRGAFACMVKHSGHAPRAVSVMPLLYLKSVLRLAVRGDHWATMNGLLEENLVEHQILQTHRGLPLDRYREVSASVAVLAGEASPDFVTSECDALVDLLPGASRDVVPGVKHDGPTEAPEAVAEAVRRHL